jgi:hypothetical protein
MIVVAKAWAGVLHMLTQESKFGTWSWTCPERAGLRCGTKYDSIAEALKDAMSNGYEVCILSNLRELADWIRDNA